MITFSFAGSQEDRLGGKLPADAMPAVFAYSLGRKLRYLYDGPWFRFRQGGSEHDYPGTSVSTASTAHLVKIYDQKARHGIPQSDAIQFYSSDQPEVRFENGYMRAFFELGQYLEIPEAVPQAVGRDFTITCKGKGDVPRPMIGLWGASDIVSVEPASHAARFTFNDDHGTIVSGDDKVLCCFSGYDAKQNNHRVLSVRTDAGVDGHVVMDSQSPSFTHASIGKADERTFKGEFIEAYMHLGDLTNIAADKQFASTRDYYAN